VGLQLFLEIKKRQHQSNRQSGQHRKKIKANL